MTKATSIVKATNKSRTFAANSGAEGPLPDEGADIVVTNISVAPVDVKSREAMIAETAYGYAERRGFLPGFELQDWLAAEAEVDKR